MMLESVVLSSAGSPPHPLHQRAAFSLHIAALLAGARDALDADLNLTRYYLDELSAIFEPDRDNQLRDDILLPHRLAQVEPPAKGGLAAWQIRRVTEYIERRLDTPLVTDDLAGVARLSAGHFCRAFKASLGETPHAYIIRQRIRRAQMLMLQTGDTLSQIACACGLTDQAHLTRLFRRVVGTTPMSWRRSWQCVD